MLEYIDRNYEPTERDVVCEYYVEPHSNYSLERVAEHLAAESSIGTWTDISTMNPRVAHTLRPSVFSINRKKGTIKIAYHAELFETSSVPQMLSSIAGNIFGMKAVERLKLLDIQFPPRILRSFRGPQFGVKGIRKLLGVRKRPLTGTIVKPKVGLYPTQHARVAYEAWAGGLDIVKDDENLTDMKFNRFEERVERTLQARDRAQHETGERKIYMPNVTAETDEMIRRAEFVKRKGGEYVMIDILTAGFAALQTLRNCNLGLVIHAHRAGHAAVTRDPTHGVSMLVLAKLSRLIGVDQLHIGTVVGKMEGSADEVEEIEQEVEDAFIPKGKTHHLSQEWGKLKPVFAVCSGGLHPAQAPRLMELMGTDIIAQFGGGCHGHPDGTRAGARAIRQAVDAGMNNESIKSRTSTAPELARAVEKWGYN